MKKIIFYLLFSLISFGCDPRNQKKKELNVENNSAYTNIKDSCVIHHNQTDSSAERKVYTFVDEMPSFNGQRNEAERYIMTNFVYPKQDEYEFSFHIEFVVGVDGKVLDVKIKNKTFSELTQADIQLLKVIKMMPAWTPGKLGGKVVPVKMQLDLNIHPQGF